MVMLPPQSHVEAAGFSCCISRVLSFWAPDGATQPRTLAVAALIADNPAGAPSFCQRAGSGPLRSWTCVGLTFSLTVLVHVVQTVADQFRS